MSDTVSQKAKRPLSPHLQVYKLPLTALLSITHRFTGMALIFGSLIVVGFFFAAASGEEYYNMFLDYAEMPIAKVILFLWSAALYYHMCNGVRHMIWDTGALLTKASAMKANYVVLLSAALLTIGTWAMACPCWKG